MGKIRVGIIGTGFGARVHAPMIANHPAFEVVAISSVSRGNIEEAKKTSGIENVYTDWKAMLHHEKLDLVVVASAVFLHNEMVLEASKLGIHILCEKPMAIDRKEGYAMIQATKNNNKLNLINHEFRFLPARQKVKEVLESGQLGKMKHIRYIGTFPSYLSLITRKRGWLGHTETGGGMLGAIGSHMIDSLHWWTNHTFKDVFANLLIHVPEMTDEKGDIEKRTADDGYQVIGTFENGASVTLELVSAVRQTENSYRLEIYGTNGSLLMKDDKEVWVAKEDQPFEKEMLLTDLTVPKQIPDIAARYYNGFNRMLDALSSSITTGKKHPYLADFQNGYTTQTVLDAIRQSANENRKVTITE